MADLRFHYTNLVDAAATVITASDEVTTLPAENVANDLLAKVARIEAGIDAEIIPAAHPTVDNEDVSTWQATGGTGEAVVTGPTEYGGIDMWKAAYDSTPVAGDDTVLAKQIGYSLPSSGWYRIVCRAKADEYSNVAFGSIDAPYVYIDLSTGSVIAAASDVTASSVVLLGDGVYEITFDFYRTSGTFNFTFFGNQDLTVLGYPNGAVAEGSGLYVGAVNVYSLVSWAKFDLGSAQAITSIAIANHTIDSTQVVTLQFNSSDSWASPAASETLTHSTGTIYKVFASKEYRWVRLKFTPVSTDIGRIFLGAYTTASRFPDRGGYEIAQIDRSSKSRTAGGQTYSLARDPFQRVTANWTLIDATQKDQFTALEAVVGSHTPFFWYAEGLHDTPLYCKLADLFARKVSGGVHGAYRWDLSVVLEEEI